MGCKFSILNPAPPANVVDYWHINGVLIDNTSTELNEESDQRVQKFPSGILYVFNSRLIYRTRHCTFSRNNKLLQFEICDIQAVNSFNKFTPCKNERTFARSVVDIVVSGGVNASNMHIGFVSKEADKIAQRLEEICKKHKLRPKIFQYNSVDIEGVELL